MIDWLAGSQQTDVRPPDQSTHPRCGSLSTLPRALVLSKHPLPALARSWRRPWSRLAQKARDTMHDCHPRRLYTLFSQANPSSLFSLQAASSFLLSGPCTPASHPLLSLPFQPFFQQTCVPDVVLRALVCGLRTKASHPADSSTIESLKVDLPGQCIEARTCPDGIRSRIEFFLGISRELDWSEEVFVCGLLEFLGQALT